MSQDAVNAPDATAFHRSMMRGVINIVIGLIFIVGGLTGKLP